MIDVIIPAFNANKTIEKTIMSLSFQTVKDIINVILIDDCSDNNYGDLLTKYNDLLNIKYIRNKKNRGAGLSRQVGIDNSKAKYILFLDSDDLLYSFDSLEKMLIQIESYDYLDSFCYKEASNLKYINDGDLHGKLYLRKFIESNNIRFNDSRYHEDNAFNSIVLLNNPKRARLNELTYIYCNNDESLTNRDPENEFNRLQIYIKNMKYVLDNTTSCSNKLREEFLTIKNKYLINYCDNLEKEKKQIVNEWLLSNEFDKLF